MTTLAVQLKRTTPSVSGHCLTRSREAGRSVCRTAVFLALVGCLAIAPRFAIAQAAGGRAAIPEIDVGLPPGEVAGERYAPAGMKAIDR